MSTPLNASLKRKAAAPTPESCPMQVADPAVRKLQSLVDPRFNVVALVPTNPLATRPLPTAMRPSPLVVRTAGPVAAKPKATSRLSGFFGDKCRGKAKAAPLVIMPRPLKPHSNVAGKLPMIVPNPEKPPVHDEGPRAIGTAKEFSGPNAQISEQTNANADTYLKTLINGTKNFKGIMRVRNRMGDHNLPYDHQRIAVKQIAKPTTKFYVLAHDMGTGKTATCLQAVAAEAVMLGRMPKVLITAPATTLLQWKDTALDWLRIPEDRLLVTNELKRVTRASLLSKDILIVSRDLLSNAFATYMKKFDKHHQIDTPYGQRWVSAWDRIGHDGMQAMPPVHSLFNLPDSDDHGWYGCWDFLVVDEAHYMRNPESRWCVSHNHVACLAAKVVMASGTILNNKPLDLAGLCKAGDCPRTDALDFQSANVWCKGRDLRTINKDTVAIWQEKFLNRATDACLSLPPLEQEVVDYPVLIKPEGVTEYNNALADAQNLRLRIERMGSASGKDLQRLMSLLQLMQQMTIHPLLAEMGAARFKSEKELFDHAASAPSGAMWALKTEIESLRAAGHHRVVVACCHTSLMEIAKRFLIGYPELGACDTFSGELSTNQRQNVKERFLKSPNSILMLSIGSGGVGLHLVPGCEAMILWGSMPFSPASTRQVVKRIHRIGQTAPVTGKVSIKHLVAYGSVDAAIGKVHADKDRLIGLVQDGDDSGFARNDDATWRKYGRIVDECKSLEETGQFPAMPILDPEDPTGQFGYTILKGMQTRDRGAPKPAATKRDREEDGDTPEAKRAKNILAAIKGTLPPMPAPGEVDLMLQSMQQLAAHFNIPLPTLMQARPNSARAASAAASSALAL